MAALLLQQAGVVQEAAPAPGEVPLRVVVTRPAVVMQWAVGAHQAEAPTQAEVAQRAVAARQGVGAQLEEVEEAPRRANPTNTWKAVFVSATFAAATFRMARASKFGMASSTARVR